MCDISEDYYLRKYYLERNEVPTLSMIKKKMKPPLAAVYFQSMNPRLREVAGLEPSLKGGGNDWVVDPSEMLKGRAVLKPIEKQTLKKINYKSIETIGAGLFKRVLKSRELEKERLINEHFTNIELTFKVYLSQLFEDKCKVESKRVTEHLRNSFNRFAYLYRSSFDKIETLFNEAAISSIEKTQEQAVRIMEDKYVEAVKNQAAMLYDMYEKKLLEEKAKLRADFIKKLDISRTEMADKIHDINADKHYIIGQLNQQLKRQNLACEIYVALNERQKFSNEIEQSNYKRQKQIKMLSRQIIEKDLEIYSARKKDIKVQELTIAMQKKLCRFMKTIEMFVSYCLNTLPDHAEFFINLEKLMLLQIDKILDEPTAESIIVEDQDAFHEPVFQPYPFYLFGDRGFKAKVDENLCPHHGGTASTSQLPAIVINKRFLYAACDNFEQFTSKIKDYIRGNRGDDVDIKDDLVYEHFVPVKCTSSQQILQVKLQSSLLKVLEQEIDYMNKTRYCQFCQKLECRCILYPSQSVADKITTSVSSQVISSAVRSEKVDRKSQHKWESYYKYVEPKTCSCLKTAKKHLLEQLPVYMRDTKFELTGIPHYEMCSVKMLKGLVKKARKVTDKAKIPSRTKDMSTQYSDLELEALCNCFSDTSDTELDHLFNFGSNSWLNKRRVTNEVPYLSMTEKATSFATARAHSLRSLIKEYPDIQNILKN